MIDEIKMRLKKSAAPPKRKNDKPFASDCKARPMSGWSLGFAAKRKIGPHFSKEYIHGDGEL
jgi:hypothetical protein